MSGETIQFERADEGSADGRREQSTIAFPYLDLEAAIDVAQAIYNRSGLGACSIDELAAEMKQVVSGAFRLKTGTARIFGLIEREGKSGIRLTELGRQIVSPDTERAARAEAFLRVPLYAAIYESYRGHLLPPMKALEREMQKLGVSSKQTDKARQAFERSAGQAGFFESGDDRLVRPKAELPTKRVDEDEPGDRPAEDDGEDRRGSKGSGSGGGDNLHPFIVGLLKELPAPGSEMKHSTRVKWLRLAANAFDMIYEGEEGQIIAVEIKTYKGDAAN
ncbi:hypothetical protein [Chelativorans sp.]|uniref:hypothetical protein n=1 Tax=Chelativorans sp. TaxID=2203393 RepID=UPI0028118493|nr:hypothetical protein [Chelativorans sp.]